MTLKQGETEMATAAQPQSEVLFPDLEAEVSEPGALILKESLSITEIPDNETYQRVCARVLDAAANIKRIEAYTDAHRENAYARWKRITETISRLTAPFKKVKDHDSNMLAAYQYKQEQLRRAAEVEEQRKAKEAADAVRDAQAEQLAKEGRVEEGVALLETTGTVAPIVAAQSTPKVAGIGTSKIKYTAKVVNLMELVKGIAEGKVPLVAVMENEQFLNNQAGALGELLQYPGVAVEKCFKVPSVRAPR